MFIYNQEQRELQERNAKRLEEVKARLGQKWLLHPENKVKRETTVDKSKILKALS